MNAERPRILSGARASSPRIHIGNYEGAVKPWIDLQDDHEMYCMIADYHGLTTLGATPPDLGYWSRECAKDFVACGLDPEKCAIFIQSRVPQHAELHLILSMFTGLGKLERVPTFKEKKDNLGSDQQVSYGLLGYPVLQSADILLYRPFGVPVGKDQAAHLELSREIGRSFNSAYGVDYFPDFYTIVSTDESRSTLPGLDMRKMSKSYDNCIYINETADETAKKIMSAFTTPSKMKLSDPGIPEGCAVCQYLRLYSPNWESQWNEDRQGLRGCVQNKRELIEILNEFLRPMRERRAQIDDAEIERILADGTERATDFAAQTMREVRQIMRLA
ncbi:MAG: tryptophan--tRNA ligase [Fimbriimonadaceae bacterium]|nr:tryptophan--tRNA ligase [Fimbriimonadaceae bacterium]